MHNNDESAFLKILIECSGNFPDTMKKLFEIPPKNTANIDLKDDKMEFWKKIFDTVAAYNDCSKASLALMQSQKKLTSAVVDVTQTLFKKLNQKLKEQPATGIQVSIADFTPEKVRSDIIDTCGKFLSDSRSRKQFLDSYDLMKKALNPKNLGQSKQFIASLRQLSSVSNSGSMSNLGSHAVDGRYLNQPQSEHLLAEIKLLQDSLKNEKAAARLAQDQHKEAQDLVKQKENMQTRFKTENQRVTAILQAISVKNQESSEFSHSICVLEHRLICCDIFGCLPGHTKTQM